MFDSPCLMRSRAIACLDAAGIPPAGGVRQPQPERHLGSGAGRAGPDDTHPHRHAEATCAPQEDCCQRREVWPSACDKPRVRNTIPPPWRCSAN